MSHFKKLHYDILENIVEHLEAPTEGHPLTTFTPPEELWQCQLTCKSLSSVAQRSIYKRVILKNYKEVIKFMVMIQGSGIGRFIQHIYVQPGTAVFLLEAVIPLCHSLKSFITEPLSYTLLWKEITNERTKGNLTRLQIIPSVKDLTYENVSAYYCAALSLHLTLRKIVIYHKDVSFDLDRSRNFPKMNTVVFNFDTFVNTHFINDNMQFFVTATRIKIEFENTELARFPVSTEFSVYRSPKVTQLSVNEIDSCSTTLCNYIVKAFPCLQELTVSSKLRNAPQLAMSTDEAVLFLTYLLGVSKFTVHNIPVKNQFDVMLYFYDGGRNPIIDKLTIHYKYTPNRFSPQSLSLTADPESEGKILIEVMYPFDLPPFIPLLLPRIGLIESSGENLLYLELDMGISESYMTPEVSNRTQNVTFSSILSQCPSLRSISIRNTALNNFGTVLGGNKREINEHLQFEHTFFHVWFLSGLSCSVSKIYQLTLDCCRYKDDLQRGPIREINMPNTEFHHITYVDSNVKEKIFLKLFKCETNTSQYYRIQGRHSVLWVKPEYEYISKNRDTLYLSICCQKVATIRISLPGHDVCFQT